MSPLTKSIFVGVLLLYPWSASAAYRLGPGDALNISVYGAADFKRRVVIDVDGDVSLPFLGEVHAADLGVEDLRKDVAERLSKADVMAAPDVTVEIAEYRPFFISGDVSRPGAIPFRPGLIVRIAVALAGGYDALRFRADNPLLSGPGFRSDYESYWAELVRQQARAATLKAELDGSKDVDLTRLAAAPLSKDVVREIADLEKRDFKMRLSAAERDRTFLIQALQRRDSDIAELKDSIAKQGVAVQTQVAIGTKMQEAQMRGVVSGARTAEDSRDLSQLRSAREQSSARLADAISARAELAKRLESFDDDRRTRIGRELQDALVGIEKTRSQVRSASERLVYTGALKAQLRNGPGPDLVIHRVVGGKPTTVNANEDSPLRPDDILEVVIRPDQLLVTPTQ